MTRTYNHTGIRDIEWDPKYPRQNYNKVFKTPLCWLEIETQIKEYL